MGAAQAVSTEPTAAATTAAASPAITQPAGTAASTTAAAPGVFNFDTIEDGELKGYAQNKGWKNLAEVVKSYRENERINGVPKSELVRMPKADAPQAEWDAFHAATGRPAAATDYQIPALPDGAKPDESFVNHMLPAMHAAGLSQRQLNAVATAWNGFVDTQTKAMAQEQQTASQADVEKLHGEWPGETFTQREELARRYVRGIVQPALGFKTDEEAAVFLTKIENAVGTRDFLKLFAHAGQSLGEMPTKGMGAGEGSQTFGMTPDQAKAKAKELMADPDFRARIMKSGKDGAEQRQLNDLAQIQAGGRK